MSSFILDSCAYGVLCCSACYVAYRDACVAMTGKIRITVPMLFCRSAFCVTLTGMLYVYPICMDRYGAVKHSAFVPHLSRYICDHKSVSLCQCVGRFSGHAANLHFVNYFSLPYRPILAVMQARHADKVIVWELSH